MSIDTDFEKQHIRNILSRTKRVENIFNQAIADLSYRISRFPKKETLDKLPALLKKQIMTLNDRFLQLKRDIEFQIVQGIQQEWGLANVKNDKLLTNYLAGTEVTKNLLQSYQLLNLDAMTAFINRADAGMRLSDRVWKVANGAREQLETYLGSGIVTGKSARGIARDVTKFMSGEGVKYKGKLIKGAKNIKYQAIRLTATETNIAYRLSDHQRRQQFDFITGVQVHLSAGHPVLDICDSMAGEYPKGFIFSGWHPLCICYTTTIQMKKDDFVSYMNTGRFPSTVKPVNKLPGSAVNYIEHNKDKFKELMQRPYGKRPYWLRDNFNKDMDIKSKIIKKTKAA